MVKGWVRSPIIKRGYRAQANTLLSMDFVQQPVDLPMLVFDGEAQLALPDPKDTKIGRQNQLLVAEQVLFHDVGEDLSVATGGVVWFVVLTKYFGGATASIVSLASLLVFGTDMLVAHSDLKIESLRDYESIQSELWTQWELENQMSRADIFEWLVLDAMISRLTESGGITLANDWGDFQAGDVVTTESIEPKFAELDARRENVTKPPNYVSQSMLNQLKKHAFQLGILPVGLLFLFFLWRRRKKKGDNKQCRSNNSSSVLKSFRNPLIRMSGRGGITHTQRLFMVV